MHSTFRAFLVGFLVAASLAAWSQEAAAPAEQPAPPAVAAPAPPPKADALRAFRQGRDLENAGKTAEAAVQYNQAIAICDDELSADPKRMDAYAIKCWSLFRLNRHQESVDVGAAALKVAFDARIVESMGESYYFLGKSDLALKYFQRYVDSGQYSERLATAYFFVGETYLRMKKWSHADIAYATAVKREPSMPRWWYRLGLACEGLGEWQRAADAFTKALSLNPGLKEASEGLARAKAKLNT